MFGPSLLIGAGLGLAFVAITLASSSGIEAQHSGLAGGLINMTQQVGGAIGLAVIAAVAQGPTHTAAHSVTAVHAGFQAALIVAAGIAAAGVLAALALPGRRRSAMAAELAPATA